jgi:putative MFS transporter
VIAAYEKQGLSMASSFKYSFLMTMGAPVGAVIGALTADSLGRKPAIIGASFMAILFGGIYPFIRDPVLLPLVGFSWSSRFILWSPCC